MPPTRTKKQLCLWVPPELDVALRALAKAKGRPITHVVEDALVEYVARNRRRG